MEEDLQGWSHPSLGLGCWEIEAHRMECSLTHKISACRNYAGDGAVAVYLFACRRSQELNAPRCTWAKAASGVHVTKAVMIVSPAMYLGLLLLAEGA